MNATFTIGGQSRIYIGSVEEILDELLPKQKIATISDAVVAQHHPSLLADRQAFLVGQGEANKTLQSIEEIYQHFINQEIDRSSFVLGIGGGIVTDMTGFAASTYMRGLEFGFISTTLLGQVDASVGGKNGVNVNGYKNMAGTFTQPRFVVCDPQLLATLSDREFRAGLGEVIKAAVIADPELFALLEQTDFPGLRQNRELLTEVIRRAIGVKVSIVERDEREAGERRKLNLGHTLGHAIEKCTSVMNHGEAVAVGMHLISTMAERAGWLSSEACDRLTGLLLRYGFTLEAPVALSRLLDEASKDKKKTADTLHLVVPEAIGSCRIVPMTLDELRRRFGL